jgi:hypothetical protein
VRIVAIAVEACRRRRWLKRSEAAPTGRKSGRSFMIGYAGPIEGDRGAPAAATG